MTSQTFSEQDAWYQEMPGQQERGSHAEWYGMLYAFTSMVMDIPTGAAVRTNLTDDEKEEAEICMSLGMKQYRARCFNSGLEIGRRRQEQKLLQEAMKEWEELDDDGEHKAFIPPTIFELDSDQKQYATVFAGMGCITSDEEYDKAQARYNRLSEQCQRIQEQDELAKQMDCYFDFSLLRQTYHQPDRERQFNGLKYDEAPSFLQELYNLVIITFSGQQQEHETELVIRQQPMRRMLPPGEVVDEPVTRRRPRGGKKGAESEVYGGDTYEF
ncbi:MAG: hypothetical protein OXF79_22400 [Chloroflexi bacterium]|nr:hypothetical protein [Chloroflexota bacterium]